MSARFAVAIETELTLADLFATLGAGFLDPSPELLARLDSLAARAERLPEPFRASVHDLARMATSMTLDELREEFERRFGHIPQSDASPYETLYGSDDVFQQTATLADIAGFYAAFGVEASSTRSERPDHVALEMEYLGLLLHRTTCAPNDDACDVALAARRSFLTDHLGRWAPLFFRRVRERGGFHGEVAALAEKLVAWEASAWVLGPFSSTIDRSRPAPIRWQVTSAASSWPASSDSNRRMILPNL